MISYLFSPTKHTFIRSTSLKKVVRLDFARKHNAQFASVSGVIFNRLPIDMAPQHIVGDDWKNYTFHMATSEDFPKISQNVNQSFLKGEPMNVLLGWDDQTALDHDGMVRIALKHGLSFYMTEKGTDEVIACNLTLDSRLEDFSGLKFESDTTHKILGFISKLDTQTTEAFQAKFKCDFYAETFITSVCESLRGQGIATEMYKRSIKFLKAKQFPVLKVAFSSPGTRAIGCKLGFEEFGRFYFKDHVDENGVHVFPNAGVDECIAETAIFL